MTILRFDNAPDDPIERLLWLSGVREQVEREMEGEWREAYFNARLTGRLDDALALRLHSFKRIMAWTRAGNELRGRMIRWGDHR